MFNLIIQKLVQGSLMILVVSAIAFALLSTAGGNELAVLSDNPQISIQTIERLRSVYGLDRPLPVRYGVWLAGFIRGDMGESFVFKTPVADLVISRFKSTFILGIAALLLALFISLSVAFISTRFRSPAFEWLVTIIVMVSSSSPRIVLALFALLLSVWIAGPTFNFTSGSTGLFLLSAAVLAIPLIAIFLAQMYGELQRVMSEQFIQLARAKGLSETAVILRHASRAALNPVLSIFGLSLGGVLGGSVIVETILDRPGIGSLIVAAVRGRDVALVMGIVVIASFAVWLGNSLAEILQLLNDKRMRTDETR